jgi:hypothetical protein
VLLQASDAYDYTFFMGDLNYRIDMSRGDVLHCINQGELLLLQVRPISLLLMTLTAIMLPPPLPLLLLLLLRRLLLLSRSALPGSRPVTCAAHGRESVEGF